MWECTSPVSALPKARGLGLAMANQMANQFNSSGGRKRDVDDRETWATLHSTQTPAAGWDSLKSLE